MQPWLDAAFCTREVRCRQTGWKDPLRGCRSGLAWVAVALHMSVCVVYLVGWLWWQQLLHQLAFGQGVLLDNLPCRLSVGMTGGGLFYYGHPLQHCSPAQKGIVSACYSFQNKTIYYKNEGFNSIIKFWYWGNKNVWLFQTTGILGKKFNFSQL